MKLDLFLNYMLLENNIQVPNVIKQPPTAAKDFREIREWEGFEGDVGASFPFIIT
jgi:hypothetical protein